MPESIQHKLDRVRRPRVQITYDVETLGSIVKTELPFVVGIMADLSGNSISGDTNPVSLKDRKFVEIDRDNFNQIMEKLGPKLTLTADTITQVGASDPVEFKSLDDFDPKSVLDKIPSLKGKFESRTRLSNLVAKLDGNPQLQKDLMDALKNLADPDKQALKEYVTSNLHRPESATETKSDTGGTTDAGTTPSTDATADSKAKKEKK